MKTNRVIQAVDTHVMGEPGRVIVGGVLDIPGETIYQKMRYLEQHGDNLRKLMLREPRGYPAANCNLILPSCHPRADAGFVIMEQTEYPGMSGTNTIAVTTVLLETGMLPIDTPVTKLTLESPAGLIDVTARISGGVVTEVTFENVPAFAMYIDEVVEVPEIGKVSVDIAYGGMFYVIIDADSLGLRLVPENGAEIVRTGEMIKAATRERFPVVHPENPELEGITIAVLSSKNVHGSSDMRNTVVVSTGQVDWNRPETWTGALDRSPCGTGTCAKMAALYARGDLALNQPFRHEGILDTVFVGELIAEADVGAPFPAVIPKLTGRAWITGNANYMVAEDDPFPEGFTVGDIWGAA